MSKITEEQKNNADLVIKQNEKIYDYRTVQWEIQHICNFFGEKEGGFYEGELYIPAYQRDYVWNNKLKCKFIESLFLNIPIPYIFISEDPSSGSMEVVDGYQRIRTIYEFLNDGFKLNYLDKLGELKGFKFSDLTIVRQRLFKRIVMNVVIFADLDIDQKKEMFSRINTTSNKLNSAEIRKGTIGGEFYDFMNELAQLPLFKKLCPLSEMKLKREESIELILRFFAYVEKFDEYNGKVDPFLTSYMSHKTKKIDGFNNKISSLNEKISNLSDGAEKKSLENELKETSEEKDEIFKNMKKIFLDMLNFVDTYFPHGFRKSGRDKIVISRTFFESISVGVGLAIIEKGTEELDTSIISKLLSNENYKEIIRTDGANQKTKFEARIISVKEALTSSILPNKL